MTGWIGPCLSRRSHACWRTSAGAHTCELCCIILTLSSTSKRARHVTRGQRSFALVSKHPGQLHVCLQSGIPGVRATFARRKRNQTTEYLMWSTLQLAQAVAGGCILRRLQLCEGQRVCASLNVSCEMYIHAYTSRSGPFHCSGLQA